jgi:tetratricopeptide (TPR) repeat protein
MEYFKKIVPILWLICLYHFGASQNQSAFNKATEAYSAMEYQIALSNFEALLEDSLASSELYYNVANCHLKLNHLGPAILNYEKALKWDPSFKEAKDNLEIAKTYIVESVVPTQEFFLKRIIDTISFNLTPSQWWWLCLACFVLASLFYILFVLGYSKMLRIRANKWIIGVIFLGLILASFGWYRYHQYSNTNYAIFMAQEGNLRQAPSEKSENVLNLSEGLKCLKLDEVNDWTLIRLEDFQQGWVKTETLTDI